MYFTKVEQVCTTNRKNAKLDFVAFIIQMTANIDQIGNYLNNVKISSQHEKEIYIEILKMLLSGFKGRVTSGEIIEWLDMIPSTLKGYLENYGLMKAPSMQIQKASQDWVFQGQTKAMNKTIHAIRTT